MKKIWNVNLDSRTDGLQIDLGYSHDFSSYDLFEYQYYNLECFLKALISFPINQDVFYDPASISETYDFTGTHSFEEAWNLCRFTQDEGFSVFLEGLNFIRFKKSEMLKEFNTYNVVGYAPNVAKMLSGNPCNMKKHIETLKKNKITVNMNVACSSFTTQNQIFHRGICVLYLIEYLEKNGFHVHFQFESISVSGNQMIKIVVPLKRDIEKLNVKMCYFPLVNPSFLRRLIFRAKEIIPGLDLEWQDGYGFPYKKNDLEILSMENTIYISTPTEMGISGTSLEDDFENFISYIDQKYHLEELLKGDDELCRKKTFGNQRR